MKELISIKASSKDRVDVETYDLLDCAGSDSRMVVCGEKIRLHFGLKRPKDATIRVFRESVADAVKVTWNSYGDLTVQSAGMEEGVKESLLDRSRHYLKEAGLKPGDTFYVTIKEEGGASE
jgi:hypothetical protein